MKPFGAPHPDRAAPVVRDQRDVGQVETFGQFAKVGDAPLHPVGVRFGGGLFGKTAPDLIDRDHAVFAAERVD